MRWIPLISVSQWFLGNEVKLHEFYVSAFGNVILHISNIDENLRCKLYMLS